MDEKQITRISAALVGAVTLLAGLACGTQTLAAPVATTPAS
jgi:hypothetical protein